MTAISTVSGYTFVPDDLRSHERIPGISAFMRIRNGAAFLEATIRSHIEHFDEIVAVYNQCTDETPDILARLAREFGPRLRVVHYLDKVYPPGSEGHRLEPPNSPCSLVNYYNYALAQTRYQIATKLDDDHLGIEPALQDVCARLRAGELAANGMLCFSGLNLARDETGILGVFAREPFSGHGDIGFFHVLPGAFFTWDQRFEHFNKFGITRRFGGFLYWHLKYLKPEFGFANYDLDQNPESRYVRKKQAFLRDRRVVAPDAVARAPGLRDPFVAAADRAGLGLPEKARLTAARWRAFKEECADRDLAALIRKSSPQAALLPGISLLAAE